MNFATDDQWSDRWWLYAQVEEGRQFLRSLGLIPHWLILGSAAWDVFMVGWEDVLPFITVFEPKLYEMRVAVNVDAHPWLVSVRSEPFKL